MSKTSALSLISNTFARLNVCQKRLYNLPKSLMDSEDIEEQNNLLHWCDIYAEMMTKITTDFKNKAKKNMLVSEEEALVSLETIKGINSFLHDLEDLLAESENLVRTESN